MTYAILIVQESVHIGGRIAERLLADLLPRAPRSHVATVTTIKDAHQQLLSRRFDLVIAPLRIDNQGIALAQDLRERAPETSVLLLADAHASPFQQRLANHLGVRVLPSDVTENALCAAAVDVLARKRIGFANPPTPSATSIHKPTRALSAEHLPRLKETLAALGREPGMTCALLIDMSGQELAAWHRVQQLDVSEIAALAAGEVQAAGEISRALGSIRPGNVTILEHDEHVVLTARLEDDLALLLVTEPSVPLGWARLALKRTGEAARAIIGTPQSGRTPELPHNFEAHMTAQIGQFVELPNDRTN